MALLVKQMPGSSLHLRLWNGIILSGILWFGGTFRSLKNDTDLPSLAAYPSAAAKRPFDSLYDKWSYICEASNNVLKRGDDFNVELIQDRSWSLQKERYRQNDLEYCRSLKDLQNAVKNGDRHWDDEECLQAHKSRPFNTSLQCLHIGRGYIPCGQRVCYGLSRLSPSSFFLSVG